MADTNSTDQPSPAIDLNNEENRLKTFEDNWPHVHISPRILAKTGCYYIGPYDQVKCHFCKIKISSWEIGSNEINEHELECSHSYKICPLLYQKETLNIPLEPVSELEKLLAKVGPKPLEIEQSLNAYTETPPEYWINEMYQMERYWTKNYTQPDFPHLKNFKDRLDTFKEWPKTHKQTPQQMSESGFFYTGKQDRVICFSCGGGLTDWVEEDDPWEEHARWYGHCNYLTAEKGLHYINSIRQKI